MEQQILDEHIIEVAGDAGEGANVTGHIFAAASARMGNSLWTVDIIPSEIRPPAHTVGGASGVRVRIGAKQITNSGDLTHLIFAFNEQSLHARVEAGLLDPEVTVLIDDVWSRNAEPHVRQRYREVLDELHGGGANIFEVPLSEQFEAASGDGTRGKNMVALGMLGVAYARDAERLERAVAEAFRGAGADVVARNIEWLRQGMHWAEAHLPLRYAVPPAPRDGPHVYMNGNQALALGAINAGFEVCAMYPITPATSVSHDLAEIFGEYGGILHQAEDELAAIGVAVGASYAGKPALTITSGPGLALMTEFQGLAVMAEIPLVIIDVQRAGPSTGMPTKVEQSDLLAAIHGAPGDAPKVVIAPSSIEECFHCLSLARKIADDFRMLVIVLSDANLATGNQLFPRPEISSATLPLPLDLSPVPPDTPLYDWDEKTGLSHRLIPGRMGGAATTSSLNHSARGVVQYDAASNQRGHAMRSRKLASLQKTLKLPVAHGNPSGRLLVVGWGSTRGAIEEAVSGLAEEGFEVSSLHLLFLNPLPPGLRDLFERFERVMTVELNYSDDPDAEPIDETSRRLGQLAQLLRAHTVTDVDCYSKVYGRPLMPREIREAIERTLEEIDQPW